MMLWRYARALGARQTHAKRKVAEEELLPLSAAGRALRDSPRTPKAMLARRGIVSPPVPRGGEGVHRLRVVVLDEGGLGCQGAKYPLLAMQGLDCSVWVEHHEAGSCQLIERGRPASGMEILSLSFLQGEELTLTATGADAEAALEICRAMAEARPEDRRELFRKHYQELAKRRSRKRPSRPADKE